MSRSRRLRHSLLAVAAIPLVAIPIATPALAVAAVGATRTYAAESGPGYGYGGSAESYGGAYGGGVVDPYRQSLGTSTATVDSEPASEAESTGVVLINTTVGYGSGQGAGTGLTITGDGIVVTNHHVVEGATAITVTDPSTGETYAATVLGYDDVHDVAVLQLEDASGLSTVATDRDAATQGEEVTAVGNAEGQGSLSAADGTVTDPSTAITVNNEDGTASDLSDLIQTDADVVSGDSGGALLDEDGEVIGMNVAATSGSAEISGYAIPIDTVLDIAAQILAGEESGDVEIGGSAAALGVQVDTTRSTLVVGVVEDGAAEAAGVTAGSTITSVGGTAVAGIDDITSVLGDHEPGEEISLSWTDTAGEAHTTTVTLGEGPVA
ncbi:serine protease, S1-C subfamily, contains C-terminal PDZ domain [Nocardioides sp. YR527]|uniref:S1C family serine protease n=1 Tax=Nocardioides sp. YR527 TaxID=1881028 RepID=UPI00088B884D|nr:trypsin-like peptidase domain-containing protein [Nocardioides sp. YR527]SDK73053.1 serine protease, S1-C subfamily, contains C-terminal PDZ domain [Nocardioides sp. YR527]